MSAIKQQHLENRAKVYQISSDWPLYMIGRHSQIKREKPRSQFHIKPDVNNKYGQSTDFSMTSGKNQVFLFGSKSLHQDVVRPVTTDKAAGLGRATEKHTFIHYSGEPEKGKIFANFVRNGICMNKDERDRICRLLSKDTLKQIVGEYAGQQPIEQERTVSNEIVLSNDGIFTSNNSSMAKDIEVGSKLNSFVNSQPTNNECSGF